MADDPRRFFKTVIKATVLSEAPYAPSCLADVVDDITTGDCVGRTETISSFELSPKQAANELLKFGSEPGFFGLDEAGNEVE